jgi:hypothetical protein
MTKILFAFVCLVSIASFANDQCGAIIEAQYCDVLTDNDGSDYCGGYVFKTVSYLEAYQKNQLKEFNGVTLRFPEDGFLYEAAYNDLGGEVLDIVLVDQYCTLLHLTNIPLAQQN